VGSVTNTERMLNLDPAKLLVIAVVAIILLGPDRLPQVARQVGGVWRSFNDYRHRMESQVRTAIPDLPSSAEIARLARSPSALLNHLSSMSPGNPGTGDEPAPVPVTTSVTVDAPEADPSVAPLSDSEVPVSAMRTAPISPEPSGVTDPGLN
jgi:sec-independent protein translocase protein TatB